MKGSGEACCRLNRCVLPGRRYRGRNAKSVPCWAFFSIVIQEDCEITGDHKDMETGLLGQIKLV